MALEIWGSLSHLGPAINRPRRSAARSFSSWGSADAAIALEGGDDAQTRGQPSALLDGPLGSALGSHRQAAGYHPDHVLWHPAVSGGAAGQNVSDATGSIGSKRS